MSRNFGIINLIWLSVTYINMNILYHLRENLLNSDRIALSRGYRYAQFGSRPEKNLPFGNVKISHRCLSEDSLLHALVGRSQWGRQCAKERCGGNSLSPACQGCQLHLGKTGIPEWIPAEVPLCKNASTALNIKTF